MDDESIENENAENTVNETTEVAEDSHDPADDFDFSVFDDEPQVGDDDPNWSDTYTDYYGNEITLGEGYTDTDGEWHAYTDKEKDDSGYNWEFKDPESVGYEGWTDKNGKWHDTIFSLHNTGKRLEDAKHAVKGWAESKADKINLAFGGSRAGSTKADFKNAEEASKAWKTYDEYAKDKQREIDEFKAKMDPNSEKDAAKLAELEATRDDYESRRNSINRDIQSSDTGSRWSNIANNWKEGLEDIGTGINQFFGGSDKYGLSKHGYINDRNGDGKTSFVERLQNMGRDALIGLGKGLGKGLGTIAQTGLSAINPLVGMTGGAFAKAAINKGANALEEYAKHHSYNYTEKELEELAKNSEALALENSDSNTDDYDSSATAASTPTIANNITRASSRQDNSPEASRHNWTELKLAASNNNKGSLGGWSNVNEVMGEKTRALSDAHFKDFMLSMFTEDPAVHNVIKTKLMLDYFDPRHKTL